MPRLLSGAMHAMRAVIISTVPMYCLQSASTAAQTQEPASAAAPGGATRINGASEQPAAAAGARPKAGARPPNAGSTRLCIKHPSTCVSSKDTCLAEQMHKLKLTRGFAALPTSGFADSSPL